MVPLERAPLKYIDTWKRSWIITFWFSYDRRFRTIFLNVRFWFEVSDGVLGGSSAVVRVNWFSRPSPYLHAHSATPPRGNLCKRLFICKTITKKYFLKVLRKFVTWEYFYEPRQSPRILNFRPIKYWHFLELATESSSKFTKIKISYIRIGKLF